MDQGARTFSMTPSLITSFTYTVRTCPHVVLTRIRSLISPLTTTDDHWHRLTRTRFDDVVRRARKLRAAPTVRVVIHQVRGLFE